MREVNREIDQLDLNLVKSHLVVDHDNDDVLIMSYITASIGYVEAYIHENILDITLEADQTELININGEFILYTGAEPKHLFVHIGNHIDEIPKNDLIYKNGYVHVTPPAPILPTMFTAIMGVDPKWIMSVNQARLLLIGQFYNYRESIADLKIMELPTGVRFVLDNVTGASI